MTEEEAKTKWCPFVRVTTNGVVVNRDNPNGGLITNADEASRCIASACMAWRLSPDTRNRVTVTIASDGSVEDKGRSTDGYCGLAGRQT